MRPDRRFAFGHELPPPRSARPPARHADEITAPLPEQAPPEPPAWHARPTLPIGELPARPSLPFQAAPRPPAVVPRDAQSPARRGRAPLVLATMLALAAVAGYAMALVVRHGATAHDASVPSADAPAVTEVPAPLPPQTVTVVSASPPTVAPSASVPTPVPRPVRAAPQPRAARPLSSDVRDPWGAR